MKCRTLLAALHFNENNGREQRPAKGGGHEYATRFLKYKKGEYNVHGIPVPATFCYVSELLKSTEERVRLRQQTENEVSCHLHSQHHVCIPLVKKRLFRDMSRFRS